MYQHEINSPNIDLLDPETGIQTLTAMDGCLFRTGRPMLPDILFDFRSVAM